MKKKKNAFLIFSILILMYPLLFIIMLSNKFEIKYFILALNDKIYSLFFYFFFFQKRKMMAFFKSKLKYTHLYLFYTVSPF